MLDKTYDPASVEPRIAARWDEAQAFKAGAGAKPGADPYCIVIPPPNVTGSLHMGHALNNTIQDILIRYNRMLGKDVLWQPGMDHAGIATQMVVERQLAQRQEPGRREMGREAFIDRVWQWKGESGGMIFNQLKRLGASCDWSRERFTMDEGLSQAVLDVFVQLYNEGLIYRGKRLVNWDPHFETAISDLEVENIEIDGHMWHFKYPLAGGETYEYVEKDADGNVTLRETRDYISIATTRPETMLGDGAVAVHPSDERYAPIVGKLCEIPVGPKEHRRQIPIITDEYPDPTFGSGAVKITGAHDFNDYGVAKRNSIPCYRLMDTKAALRADGEAYAVESAKAQAIVASGALPSEAEIDAINLVPDEYRGLDRFEARKRVVADIDAEGLMIRVEDKKVMQPFGDRSKVVIEPMLTDQWFCDAKTLAQPAIASVREGRTKFVPETWEKTYFQWMENIEPWCISRQLWWGHRIPVWYGPGGKAFCAKNYELALEQAETYYNELNEDGALGEEIGETKISFFSRIGVICFEEEHDPTDRRLNEAVRGETLSLQIIEPEDGGYPEIDIRLVRDPDVLDTWFSSALWPFSTLGWPDKTPELAKYYQTDVLVTGFDIIFFWVARMMMMGNHFMKDEAGNIVEPFHTVYVHALVRDKDGQKMSKSKGNVIDPLELIDQYGADALRFTLAVMAAQGRDVKLDPARIEGYRNFGTKLWNATRFAEMNGAIHNAPLEAEAVRQPVNRWILTELSRAAAEITRQIEDYRFNDAAGAAYRFVWNTVCDWYIELLKPVLNDGTDEEKDEARRTLGHVLDACFALLHPFMPFMTEELWAETAGEGGRATLLAHAPWPASSFDDADAAADINALIDLVTAIRSTRSEMNVQPAAKAPLVAVSPDADLAARLERHAPFLARLARVTGIVAAAAAPKGAVQVVSGGATFFIPLGDLIDLAAEKDRLEKALAKAEGEAAKIAGKLANPSFAERAPEAVVAAEKAKLDDAEALIARLREGLSRVAEAGN